MDAENIFGFSIFLLVAIVMMVIGIVQIRKKTPVAFYSGEEPPRAEDLTDVKAWNWKHGLMWLLFGVTILVGYGVGVCMGDEIWSAIPMCGGVILPLPFMVWGHHRLRKR